MCELDALQGGVTIHSQLHAAVHQQRHLSCSAALLVSVTGDVASRLQQSSQSRAVPAVRALMANERDVDSQPGQGSGAATAAHNTAHLAVAASTASGEDPLRNLDMAYRVTGAHVCMLNFDSASWQ